MIGTFKGWFSGAINYISVYVNGENISSVHCPHLGWTKQSKNDFSGVGNISWHKLTWSGGGKLSINTDYIFFQISVTLYGIRTAWKQQWIKLLKNTSKLTLVNILKPT